MTYKVIEITSEEGLRSKAAALLVQISTRFSSQILIEKGNVKINAKSIMGVLSLGAMKGDTVRVVITGEDEKEAMEELTKFVANKFAE